MFSSWRCALACNSPSASTALFCPSCWPARHRCRESSELSHSQLRRARLPGRRTSRAARLLLRLEILGRLPQSSSRDRLKLGVPDLSARTVFDLRKPLPFRGCLALPKATKVNPCRFRPPGAESTLLDRIREEVCGPSSKCKLNHLPYRRRRNPHPRQHLLAHPLALARAVPRHAILRASVRACKSRVISPAPKTCRSTARWRVRSRCAPIN